MKDIQKIFGDRIRKIRLEKGISQEELAYKAGLHRTYVSDVERGYRNVSIKNIQRIALALKTDMSEIFKN